MIIVTGDAGFISNSIVKSLNDKGVTGVLAMDNLKNDAKFVDLVDPNIASYMDKEDFLIQVMTGEDFGGIEAIFHEGACSSTTEWDSRCMIDNSCQCFKELLHYCLEREIPFLCASSAATYGGRTSDFTESREYEKLLNVCGYSKFLFDRYMRRILPEANSQVVGFRYFNVYGPREGHRDSIVSVAFYLNTQLNNGETPELLGGSKNFKRDFVYVGDVTVVNLRFLESGVSGIFDLGTGRAESFQVVADATLACHKRGSTEHIPFPERLKGYYQAFTQADLADLHAASYDKPFKTVAEGVMEYMAWLNRDV